MKFSNSDIADYYRQTQIHYKKWWKLESHLSLHYGLWFEATKDFETALKNTNREMAKLAGVKKGDLILDAGCGVGGAAIFLAKEFNCTAEGITLDKGQVELAQKKSIELGLDSQVKFSQQSFSETKFKDNTFDVVWACESSCYANPKDDFLKEAYRILKPGGKIILSEYFLTPKGMIDKNKWMSRWANLWALDKFYTWADLSIGLRNSGLKLKSRINYTEQVFPSSKKMYQYSLMGAITTEIYNLFNNTSRFAKKHYQSGLFQYRALKNKEWEYWLVCLEKEGLE